MKIEGLLKRLREEFLKDASGISEKHFKWKTSHLLSALAQAERELCRRLYLLSDSTTPEICHLSITAIDGAFPRTVALDDRILRIDRLKFPGVSKPLDQTTTSVLDQQDSGWDEKSGTPTGFVADLDDFSLTFNRQPIAAGTVMMSVRRLPRININEKALDDSPELKQKDDELLHGALKYLFIKPDLEGYDPGLSAMWSKQFEADIKQLVQNQAAMNPQAQTARPERF